MRNLAALAILLTAVLAACGNGGSVVSSSGSGGAGGMPGTGGAGGGESDAGPDAPAVCPMRACPPGAFATCEPGDTTVPCCKDGASLDACARGAGILTHDGCGACPSGECAVSAEGAVACCSWTTTPDGGHSAGPCDMSVP